MKAITLFQPHASLMAVQEKRVETRSWRTHHTGPLAIHAAKYASKAYREFAERNPYCIRALARHDLKFAELPRSRVLCVVNVLGCFRVEELHKAEFVLGRKLGLDELAFGNYSAGRYAWVTEFVETIVDPGPTNGAQGMWEWLRGRVSLEVQQERAIRAYGRGETTL